MGDAALAAGLRLIPTGLELAQRLGVPQPDAEPEPPTVDAPQSAPLGIENRLG